MHAPNVDIIIREQTSIQLHFRTLTQQLPRLLQLLRQILLPNPLPPPVQIGLDSPTIIPGPHPLKVKDLSSFPTRRHQLLAPGTPDRIVGFESPLDVRGLLYCSEEVGQDVGVLERHSGAGTMMGGARVGGVAQEADAAFGVSVGGEVVESAGKVSMGRSGIAKSCSQGPKVWFFHQS